MQSDNIPTNNSSNDTPEKVYGDAINTIKQIFQVLPKGEIQFKPILDIAKRINSIVTSNPDGVFVLTKYTTPDLYLYSHSVNVAIITALMGIELKYTNEQLENLCLSALLHDLGMIKSTNLATKSAPLTEEEFSKIKKHPEDTLVFLDKIKNITKNTRTLIGKVILQVHERKSGTGYPKGLKIILEFAHIIGIADTYEAMTHQRNWRKRFLPHPALRMLMEIAKTDFDMNLVQLLVNTVSFYPPGSYVLLSNNEIARVIGANKGLPEKPKQKIIIDSHGKHEEGERYIDLSKDETISIIKSVDETKIKTDDKKLRLQLKLYQWWIK